MRWDCITKTSCELQVSIWWVDLSEIIKLGKGKIRKNWYLVGDLSLSTQHSRVDTLTWEGGFVEIVIDSLVCPFCPMDTERDDGSDKEFYGICT